MPAEHGTLYVVATPIGNLEDITLRALRVLGEVDLVAAEHAPVARLLLHHYEIDTVVVPYHESGSDAQRLVERMLRGESIALVSDAGTPAVSDPGRYMVKEAFAAGVRVVPIPGPSAPTALWSTSGVDQTSVYIYGFLPRKRAARRNALLEIIDRGLPTMFMEAPHRLRGCLADLAQLSPDAELVVGRELTKLYEQVWRGTPSAAVAAFAEPRGEFTILIVPPAAPTASWTDAQIADALVEAAAQGASRSQAARYVAQQSGRPRREVYSLWPVASER